VFEILLWLALIPLALSGVAILFWMVVMIIMGIVTLFAKLFE
jgi:hypothetical protein